LKLITHDKIKIKLNGYGAENKQEQTENEKVKENLEINQNEGKRNEMYSLMVVYGFLNYYRGEIRIPNKELYEKFEAILSTESDFKIYKELMNDSQNMLEAT